MDEHASDRISRRTILKRIGAGAAVAWSAPILSTVRVPAFAASVDKCPTCKPLCSFQAPPCGNPPLCFCYQIVGGSCACVGDVQCGAGCSSNGDCGEGQVCVLITCDIGYCFDRKTLSIEPVDHKVTDLRIVLGDDDQRPSRAALRQPVSFPPRQRLLM